jgi:hypothetical protein
VTCEESIGAGRLGRFGFLCVPSASRGHAVERAFHLLLNTLNSPAADATLTGNPQDAFASAQLSLDALFDGGIDPRPAELLALRYGARSNSAKAPQTWNISLPAGVVVSIDC